MQRQFVYFSGPLVPLIKQEKSLMAWFCVKPVKYCPPPKTKCETKEVKKVDCKPKCEIKYTAPKLLCLKSYECAPKYCKPVFCKPICNGGEIPT
ncbi:MAG: hypothetical protein ACKVP4_08910 [Hyphomicrobium sp.]